MTMLLPIHATFGAGSSMEAVVFYMRLRAVRGEFDGIESARNIAYLRSCTADHLTTGSRLIYTRDTGHHSSGWFKNPDYERCIHLSISYRESHTGEREPQRRKQSIAWARMFFGDELRLAWIEPPHSPEGIRCDVLHFRVFCDEHWQPMKPRGEVYSIEFTEIGWKSFSELGAEIESTLTPG